MHTDPNQVKAKHPETELHGDLQSFCGSALPPDHASLEPRVRRGRPADSKLKSPKSQDRRHKQK
jgi:hypothetical protein